MDWEGYYLLAVINMDQYHDFVSYLWNLSGEILRENGSYAAEGSIRRFEDEEACKSIVNYGEDTSLKNPIEDESNYIASYHFKENNIFTVVIIRRIHSLPEKKRLWQEPDFDEAIESLGALFAKGKKEIEKDLRERILSSVIEVTDYEDEAHEILLKDLVMDISTRNISEHPDDNPPSMAVAIFLLTFELINLSDLEPPEDDYKYGGAEYERIKERTLVGK